MRHRIIRPLALALRRILLRRFPPYVDVRVYLNADPGAMLRGYRTGAPLTLAYHCRLLIDPDDGADAIELLDRVYAAFNGHPDTDLDNAHTRAWYSQGHRSLSVGDVIVLDDDLVYARSTFGWLSLPPSSAPRRPPTSSSL
ncbi:hypothetical protein [Nocardia takedensis]|uniref:hypothetical protein n=1 Tax=Nocardia takedensis TaxID=259390 RepID=UPI0012F66C6B|nr:hypothetical protein [Nocardia takedensis]